MTMRMGFILSALAHGGLLACVLLVFASPVPFNAVPEGVIAVDVIPASEIDASPTERLEQRTTEQQAPALESGMIPPRQGAVAAQEPPAAMAPGQAQADPVMFDVLNTVRMLAIRAPGTGFDAPAEKPADLTRGQVSAFKAHLRTCWTLPEGVSALSDTWVVLRVSLEPTGALRGEPTLVEARAAQDGPAVFQAARRALQQCQPYTVLPRERYKEWKVLDVSLSPREMSGG